MTTTYGFDYHQPDDNVHEPTGGYTNDDEVRASVANARSAERLGRLQEFAQAQGDISHLLTADELAELGVKCVQEWRKDDATRDTWKERTKRALDDAAQERTREGSRGLGEDGSDVRYPILTVAAQQFGARAYPAIVKGDEAVALHMPPAPPEAQPVPPLPPQAQNDPQAVALFQKAQQGAQALQQAQQAYAQLQARARRVRAYMNDLLFYKMDGFEADVDALVNGIPIVGKFFKKVSYLPGRGTVSELVPAMQVVVAVDTRSIATCPRITHEFQLYPYEIEERMRSGVYRDIDLPQVGDDREAPRKVIEQHRMHDMDGDGLAEPWIVTVDVERQMILRVEAAFDAKDITVDDHKVISIKRWNPWADFDFLPDPKGRAYAMGLGQQLGDLNDVIDTMINQLTDAGTAQIAGGGFIASGLRLQGAGQSSTLRWKLGEYKTVSVRPGELQNSIYERTLPQPSDVSFKLLDMMLGAANKIANTPDIVTGDSPATAPVGTTMAVADQALQPFNAVYKRIYRGLTREFQLIYECEARWGRTTDQEYALITGDPTGSFKQDFVEGEGSDLRPISDPRAVTRQQRLAKAQGLNQLASSPIGQAAGMNPRKVASETLSAMDYENPESYFAPPPQPDPRALAMQDAEISVKQTEATLNRARAVQAAGSHVLSVTEAQNVADRGDRAEARADHKEAREDAVAAHGILSTLDPANRPDQSGGNADVAGAPGDAVGDGGDAASGGGSGS